MAKHGHAAHDFELNLTPIIDCFVTLICFLLLSATYVNLVSMDSKVPIAVPASSEAAKNKPTFKLEVNVKQKGIEIIATDAGQASGKRFIAGRDSEALGKLHEDLVRVKHERPKEFSLHFNSEIDMSYEELVRFMDVTRNLAPKDGNLVITDERNGKSVKMDTLFPDFVMAGLK